MYVTQRPINREDQLRKDEAALTRLWNDTNARVLPVCQGKCLMNDNNPQPHTLAWLPVQKTWQLDDAIFLGTTGDIPWFAITLEENTVATLSLPPTTDFFDLRAIGMHINHDDAALLIYAKGLSFWHNQIQFCDRCGSSLQNTQGGHVKKCTNNDCAQLIFPRTDPAVIMLITHTDESGIERCLLGRSPVWAPGMYSTLAGFVESGESLEQAVAREVFEESGVEVENVQYITSQPWPFPRSIMLGFRAEATTTHITIDEQEIEDARWFSRDDLKQFGTWGDDNSEFQLPRGNSIASHLINQWREQ